MSRTALRTHGGRLYRCENCNRVVYLADLVRGTGRLETEWFDTLGGPDEREVVSHTYDCEKVSRRLLSPESPQ